MPTGSTDAAAPDASIPLLAVCEGMHGLPTKVGTDTTGHVSGALGAGPNVETRGYTTMEFREGAVSHVHTDEMGLPEPDNAGTVLEQNDGPGVLRMHG